MIVISAHYEEQSLPNGHQPCRWCVTCRGRIIRPSTPIVTFSSIRVTLSPGHETTVPVAGHQCVVDCPSRDEALRTPASGCLLTTVQTASWIAAASVSSIRRSFFGSRFSLQGPAVRPLGQRR